MCCICIRPCEFGEVRLPPRRPPKALGTKVQGQGWESDIRFIKKKNFLDKVSGKMVYAQHLVVFYPH